MQDNPGSDSAHTAQNTAEIQRAPPQGAAKPAIRPAVGPAVARRRHFGLMLSFAVLVLLPVLLTCIYLWTIAEDQYASVSGFTVRKEEGGGASGLLGGLAQLTGGSASSDGDILYEYILSQELVSRVEGKIGLRAHYNAPRSQDPVFALKHDSSIEELAAYWQRIVRIAYDQGSGLMEVRVLAFSPIKAQQVSEEILRESQNMINALNTQAREDAMRYARSDLVEAVARLKGTREALIAFQIRTQIVDPEADIQGRLGVMNNLQQQLAEALIDFDLLLGTTANANDPRLVQAARRIEVIRARISDEREAFATGDTQNGAVGEDYPNLLAEFEGLVVEREFAEQTYRAALTALTLAQANAQRQSRYLATYISPTLPETSEYPQRFMIAGLVLLFLSLSWGIMALVYYSIRDRG